MTCEQFEAMVHDLNRPGALDEATCTLAQFHAQTCGSCGARLAQARALSAGLQALEASQQDEGAPPRVETMLRSAFLRNQWQMARARAVRRWAAVGIAAALLLTAGLVWRYERKSGAPAESARIDHSAGAVVPGAPKEQGAAANTEKASNAQADDEFAGDFVPYPAGGSIMPYESAQIVRVSMPGSALVAMGFPVDGDRAGDSFTADILVGDDGMPRAIRFPR